MLEPLFRNVAGLKAIGILDIGTKQQQQQKQQTTKKTKKERQKDVRGCAILVTLKYIEIRLCNFLSPFNRQTTN